MKLRLTDQLTCPRCRSDVGLILLAERVEDRRVLEGQLGCPGCRSRFRVHEGIAEFAEETAGVPAPAAPTEAVRLAAMLGVAAGPGMLLLLGEWTDSAAQIAALLEDVEVVVAQRTRAEHILAPDVSRLHIAEQIPLRSASMHAVAVAAPMLHMLPEAVRVTRLAARVVLLGVTSAMAQTLDVHGLRVLAAQEEVVVAVRQS
ncbi:MAG TPA: Trm112 family protein [Longimicrobiales bacterium]|nr:Trm112 family protein [Longimicrobiales bacterium]